MRDCSVVWKNKKRKKIEALCAVHWTAENLQKTFSHEARLSFGDSCTRTHAYSVMFSICLGAGGGASVVRVPCVVLVLLCTTQSKERVVCGVGELLLQGQTARATAVPTHTHDT